MILYVITIVSLSFVILWFVIPDMCHTEDEDLPALGDSIDRAIALAASLPDEPLTKRTTPSHVVDVWAGMAEVEYIPARAQEK